MEMETNDQVDDLLGRMRLERLAQMDCLAYSKLVKHFLGTMRFEENDEHGNGRFHFKIGPDQYSLTFITFCDFPSFDFIFS